MGTKRIDELPVITELTDDDLLIAMDGAANTRQITALNAKSYLGAVSVSASGDTTGVTDTAAIAALLGDGARIVLGAGTFYLTAIAVANRGVQILGAGRDRGTTLRFVSSSGSLFSLGTDDGLAYDRDGYDGIQGFTLKNLSIITDAPATALSNGGGVYRTGTYAVRDWRGGSVVFDSVLIQSFEWAFWGIQSDINYFTDCIIRDNKVGFYLGPRSDQATFQHIWTFTNDIVFDLDAAKGTTVNGWQSADDGSTSTPPARIRQGSWTRTAEGITFNQPWLEHYNNAATVEAFFEVGVGDTSALGGVTINDPLVLTNATGADPYCKRLVRLGYVAGLDVSAPRGQLSNLTALVQCVGTSGVTAPASGPYVNVHNTMGQSFTLSDNTTTGSPQMTLWTHADLSHPNSGNGQMIRWQIYASNPGVRGGTGRLHVRGATATAERDFYIGADADSQFTVVHPDSATGNTTRLAIPRRIVYGTAAPTSGTYAVGDLCVNQAPARLGSAGAYYAVFGWTCTGAGAPGTWQALNIRTEASEIVGAASDTAAGVVELATSAETITGTDTARAVTPAGLAAAATAGAWAGGASDPLDGNALIAQRIFIR